MPFTGDSAGLWAIRKGLFPAVGAVRTTGTTVIIEDVAFPIERLAEGVAGLQALFDRFEYGEAIIFGHALEETCTSFLPRVRGSGAGGPLRRLYGCGGRAGRRALWRVAQGRAWHRRNMAPMWRSNGGRRGWR